MPFKIVKGLGVQEVKEEILLSNVAVTAGDFILNVSGYASNAYASARTYNAIGIAMNTVDNSGGSAGDKSILVEVSPLMQYEVGTDSTMSQALVWTNVDLASASTIDENDPKTIETGVIKIRAMISTSKAQVSINFASPASA